MIGILLSLWLPILLSAVLVFVVSSIIHMVLRYHAADWRKLPQEEALQETLRGFKIPPGDYMLPCPTSAAERNSAGFRTKIEKGPVLVMTTWPAGEQGMGLSLVLWFIYAVAVSKLAAYVAGLALAPGATYSSVFRIVGTVAFAAYAMALFHHSIWYKRSWMTTLRSVFDGLIYALVTAGTFGWLWPDA
jgi:hypothetical protein